MMHIFFFVTCAWVHAESLSEYQRKLIDQYDNPVVLYNAGCAARGEQNYEQALAYFQAAHGYDAQLPDHQRKELWYNTGNVYAQCKQYEQALAEFEQYDRVFPGDEQVQRKIEYLRKMRDQQQESKDSEQQSQDQQNTENSQPQEQEKTAGEGQQQDRQRDQGERQQGQQKQDGKTDSNKKTENSNTEREHEAEQKSGNEQGAAQGEQDNHDTSSQEKKYKSIQNSKKISDERTEQMVQGILDQEQRFQKEFIKAQTRGLIDTAQNKRW